MGKEKLIREPDRATKLAAFDGKRISFAPYLASFVSLCTGLDAETFPDAARALFRTRQDLREAAKILKDKKISSNVHAMVVPGSGLVKEQAEQEGLDKIFVESGFEWREPGCSMCLAMNADKLKPEERCASTSNRNFEGRQGRGGRTHLVSPGMAAAAAISGSLDDVRKYQN